MVGDAALPCVTEFIPQSFREAARIMVVYDGRGRTNPSRHQYFLLKGSLSLTTKVNGHAVYSYYGRFWFMSFSFFLTVFVFSLESEKKESYQQDGRSRRVGCHLVLYFYKPLQFYIVNEMSNHLSSLPPV